MKTHENIPEYIVAYLHDEANEEQSRLASAWAKDPENKITFDQLRKVNALSAELRLFNEFDPEAGRLKVKSKYRANKLKVLSIWVQRIAAILFIPALIGSLWYFKQQKGLREELSTLIVTQEIITQPGTKTHLFLPDGTEVWLNSSSTLRFPSVFSGNDRRIYLDGEGYFQVFKDRKKPFIVSTKFQEVEAVGTAFDLSVYSGDIKFYTTLAEGKVKVTDHERKDQIMFLEQGMQLNFNTQNKKYKEQIVRVQDVIAWKDGVLIFNETPFHEVAVKLGRWFNADIKITDQSLANYRFTGTFTSESLDQVLELLTMTTPIDYSSSQRKILENKSFSKQEIKIWKSSKSKINLNKSTKPMR